jgi:hypothetical protein
VTTYWHGGGRIDGTLVLPGAEAGTTRAAGDAVYVTTDRALAETYASTTGGPTAWVYEVEPLGGLEPSPSLVGGPTISYTCEAARIIRRYTISNARRRRLRGAVARARA